MKWMKLLPALVGAAFLATAAHAEDKGLDNHVKLDPYYNGLKGKKVVFVPLAMGFDLTEGWAAIMKKQAADLGYSFDIRDPNWSTDAGTRAITAIIAEKPDLAIIHNPDLQSYARLEQRMVQAGARPMTWIGLLSELQYDWANQDTYDAVTRIVTEHGGAWGPGINYVRAMKADKSAR